MISFPQKAAGISIWLIAAERLKEEGREKNIRALVLAWTKEGYSVKEIAELLKQSEDFVRKTGIVTFE